MAAGGQLQDKGVEIQTALEDPNFDDVVL